VRWCRGGHKNSLQWRKGLEKQQPFYGLSQPKWVGTRTRLANFNFLMAPGWMT